VVLPCRIEVEVTTTATITAQVRCINKIPRDDPYDRIRAIGGINSDGGRWKLTQEEAIRGIELGKYSFYVQSPGTARTRVVVATSRAGRKYLKTAADGDLPNNLLSLPECP